MKFGFRRYRPRLALVLLLVGLSLLSVPIGAVLYLNVIENYLLRRTETKLIARGDIVVSAYRTAFQRYYPAALGLEGYGKSPLYHQEDMARPKLWYFDPKTNRYTDKKQTWFVGPIEIDLPRKRFQSKMHPPIAGGPVDQFADKIGQELHSLLRDARRTMEVDIKVTDFNGIIIASTGANRGESIEKQEEVKRALEGKLVISLHNLDQNHEVSRFREMLGDRGILVQAAMPVILDNRVLGTVLLSRKSRNTYELIIDNLSFVVPSAIIFLVLLLLTTLLVSRLINNGIRTLTKQLNRTLEGGQETMQPPLLAPQAMGELFKVAKKYQSSVNLEVHNIKNSLWSIKETTKELGAMSEEDREQFLSNMVADIDTLSDEIKEYLEPLEAPTTITKTLEDVKRHHPHVQLERELDVAIETLRLAITSRMLSSIVTGLVDNSYKYGGSEVRVTFYATATSEPGMMRINVSDDGPGISKENVGRIFDRQFTTSGEKGGSGLGLSTIQALLDAHGGRIELLSHSPGKTTFSIVIPLIDNSDN